MKKDVEWYEVDWQRLAGSPTVANLVGYRKESEEIEVKDIEWVKNRIRNTFKFKPINDKGIVYKIAMEEALGIIDQLDEPEKVVVPKFVADWIEETKKNDRTLVFAICHIYDENELGESPTEKENRIYQWMESNDNEEVFARAWLGGYEVEKEQKILRF